MQVAGCRFRVLGSLFSIFRPRGRRARLDVGVGRAESDRFCGGMRGMTDLGAGPGARSVGCLCVWGGVLSAFEHSRWCLRTPHLFCFSRSVRFRVEIGSNPCRDRSASASRSVQFRVEIGRTPRRDRSASASKSVVIRAEIGPAHTRAPGRVFSTTQPTSGINRPPDQPAGITATALSDSRRRRMGTPSSRDRCLFGEISVHPEDATMLSPAAHGVWRSLVARFVRDEEVVGSNPATPTHIGQDP